MRFLHQEQDSYKYSSFSNDLERQNELLLLCWAIVHLPNEFTFRRTLPQSDSTQSILPNRSHQSLATHVYNHTIPLEQPSSNSSNKPSFLLFSSQKTAPPSKLYAPTVEYQGQTDSSGMLFELSNACVEPRRKESRQVLDSYRKRLNDSSNGRQDRTSCIHAFLTRLSRFVVPNISTIYSTIEKEKEYSVSNSISKALLIRQMKDVTGDPLQTRQTTSATTIEEVEKQKQLDIEREKKMKERQEAAKARFEQRRG